MIGEKTSCNTVIRLLRCHFYFFIRIGRSLFIFIVILLNVDLDFCGKTFREELFFRGYEKEIEE